MVYHKNEVDMVVEDIRVILTRFENILTEAVNEIKMAKEQPLMPESFASLNRTDHKIKGINLIPVIDTLEGILQDS